jgi:ADP-ribose pyrophosphatase YjhB (NUDIX family)
MQYHLLKNIAAICFNLLNLLLRGNLPPLACACVIVEDNGRYLVIKQQGDQYVFPGGFMRWHEQPTQTALRETREETGLEINIENFAGYQIYNSRSLRKISTINLIYDAHITGGTLRASVEGQPLWLSKDDIPGKLSPIARKIFDEHFAYHARQILQKDSYSNH